MLIRFIGDVHGHIDAYMRVRGNTPSFQIGDMGLGFPNTALPKGGEHRFIRGNHDDPAACRKHPNYAGDFGYDPDCDLFYMGGAWSIDGEWRKERMLHNPRQQTATERWVQFHPLETSGQRRLTKRASVLKHPT